MQLINHCKAVAEQVSSLVQAIRLSMTNPDSPAAQLGLINSSQAMIAVSQLYGDGLISQLYRDVLISQLYRDGLISQLHRDGLISQLHRDGLISQLHRELHRDGLISQLHRDGLIASYIGTV